VGIDGIAHVPRQPAWYEKKRFRGSKKVFLIGKRKSFKHMLNNQPNMCEKTVEDIKNRFNRPQKVLLTAKLEHHHGLPKIVNFFKVSGQQGLENSEKLVKTPRLCHCLLVGQHGRRLASAQVPAMNRP
jgi:hypothetical protein